MKYVVRNLHVLVLAGLVSFAISRSAIAHPGHGVEEHGVAHWLFAPTHGGIFLFVLAVCLAFVVLQSSRRRYQSVSSR